MALRATTTAARPRLTTAALAERSEARPGESHRHATPGAPGRRLGEVLLPGALSTHLNQTVLRRVRQALFLPLPARTAWQTRFPELGDANGVYFVVKFRFGAIDLAEGRSFDELVALIEDPRQRDAVWEYQP